MGETLRINRVLVLGGRGFIGQSVVAALKQLDYKVTTADRKKSGSDHIQIDLQDHRMVEKALAGFDALINLVGLTPILKAKKPTYYDIHVNGVRNLIEAAKLNGLKKALFITVHGAAADSPLEYYRTKGVAEQLIKDSGLNYSIVRPSFVFGHGSEFENLADKFRYFPLLPFPRFNATVYPVYVRDLAKIVATQLGSSKATISNALGPEEISVYQMVRSQFKESGITLIPLPGGVVAALFKLISPLPFIPFSKDLFSIMKNSVEPQFGGGEIVRGEKLYSEWLSGEEPF